VTKEIRERIVKELLETAASVKVVRKCLASRLSDEGTMLGVTVGTLDAIMKLAELSIQSGLTRLHFNIEEEDPVVVRFSKIEWD